MGDFVIIALDRKIDGSLSTCPVQPSLEKYHASDPPDHSAARLTALQIGLAALIISQSERVFAQVLWAFGRRPNSLRHPASDAVHEPSALREQIEDINSNCERQPIPVTRNGLSGVWIINALLGAGCASSSCPLTSNAFGYKLRNLKIISANGRNYHRIAGCRKSVLENVKGRGNPTRQAFSLRRPKLNNSSKLQH